MISDCEKLFNNSKGGPKIAPKISFEVSANNELPNNKWLTKQQFSDQSEAIKRFQELSWSFTAFQCLPMPDNSNS